MARRAAPAVFWALAAWIVVVSAAGPGEATLPRAVLTVSPLEGTVGDALEFSLEVVTPQGYLVERPELGPLGVTLDIRSVIPEGGSEEELADLKGPAGVPPDYSALRQAVLILLTLLAISGVAWWLHRRWAHRLTAVAAPADPFHRMAPHEWVYKELQHLLDRRLAEQGQVDSFYSELSRILKMYLGGRYRVDLMEKTTTEVPDELRGVGTPREAALGARELLEGADRVKFAGDRPSPPECREAVEAIYRIVDATRPAEAAGDADRGAAA